MKKTVVIYESKYGYTKRYAEWISESLSCPLFERKSIRPEELDAYDTIIYGGGLYAGGVSGIKFLTRHYPQIRSKNILIFTCGLADPGDPFNTKQIQTALTKVFSPEMQDKIRVFHLRGGIDYSRLTPVHKAMMAMLRRMLLKKPESSIRKEDQGILDTYGKAVDFTDRETILPLVRYASSL
ncbi:MAG: flavodoxin domain-containing protein [Eubacteriales bacterium]|nr:flavodoxin domain-containing protein [Eubacteriales bacterium]